MSVEVVTTDTVILTGMVLSIIFGLVCGFLLGREAGKAIGYCDRMDEEMIIKKRDDNKEKRYRGSKYEKPKDNPRFH
jgi:H+/gluconate symporter-like permease